MARFQLPPLLRLTYHGAKEGYEVDARWIYRVNRDRV